jgi:hypothetical protein
MTSPPLRRTPVPKPTRYACPSCSCEHEFYEYITRHWDPVAGTWTGDSIETDWIDCNACGWTGSHTDASKENPSA